MHFKNTEKYASKIFLLSLRSDFYLDHIIKKEEIADQR